MGEKENQSWSWIRPVRAVGQPIIACSVNAAILHANLPARQIARQLGATCVEKLLPGQHASLINQCFGSRKPQVGAAHVGTRRLSWIYRCIRNRNMVCTYGTMLTETGTYASIEAARLKSVMANLAIGILIVDDDLVIDYANSHAIKLLESTWAAAAQGGQLFIALPWIRAELQAVIAQDGGALVLHRNQNQAPLELLVRRMPDQISDVNGNVRGLSLICITDPEFVAPAFPERIKSLYGLTPAEVKIATYLKQGPNLEDAARFAGIGRDTINTHLRSLRRKTNTAQTSALVWRLNCSVATALLATEWISGLIDFTQ